MCPQQYLYKIPTYFSGKEYQIEGNKWKIKTGEKIASKHT